MADVVHLTAVMADFFKLDYYELLLMLKLFPKSGPPNLLFQKCYLYDVIF